MAFFEKDLAVKTSSIPGAGLGLFSNANIPKGSRIVEYKGKITSWHEARLDATNGYIYFIKPDYVIDARDFPKSLARYANDASGLVKAKGKTNNARFESEKLRVYLVAAKDIAAGDEIFVSYGKKYWDTVRKNLALEKQKPKNQGEDRL